MVAGPQWFPTLPLYRFAQSPDFFRFAHLTLGESSFLLIRQVSLSCCGNCAPPRSGKISSDLTKYSGQQMSWLKLSWDLIFTETELDPAVPIVGVLHAPGQGDWLEARLALQVHHPGTLPSPGQDHWGDGQEKEHWHGSEGVPGSVKVLVHLMPFLKTTDTFQSAMAVVQLGWVGQLMNWWGFLNKVGLSVIINGIPRRYLSGIEVATRWSECYWGGARGALIHRLGSDSLHLGSSPHWSHH